MINPVVTPAVALDEVSLQHKIELRPAAARRFAYNAGSHGVESWRLRELIRQIDRLIPPMGFGKLNGLDNPNDGKPHHWYTIGKEYSRVLYLNIVKPYLSRAPFDYQDLTRKLDALACQYRADEHWTTENDDLSYVYRLWWD